MKFHFGKIPDTVDFSHEEENWIPIKEPSPWLAQLFALPIGFALAALFIILWLYFAPATLYNFPSTLIFIDSGTLNHNSPVAKTFPASVVPIPVEKAPKAP